MVVCPKIPSKDGFRRAGELGGREVIWLRLQDTVVLYDSQNPNLHETE